MKKVLILIFLIVFMLSVYVISSEKMRPVVDEIGFSTTKKQIEKIIFLGKEKEEKELRRTREFLKGKKIIAAISPHDDHMYAGKIYLHALPYVAESDTVVIFGVTHSSPRKELNNPKNIIILDNFDKWKSPYSPMKVNIKLRDYLKKHLSEESYIVSNKAHLLEHSIEAMLAFLKYYNRDVKILPVMVSEMDFKSLNIISSELSKYLLKFSKENNKIFGKHISFLISTDATHYGPDFDYSPFGVDREAHIKGTNQDKNIGQTFLSGNITKKKVKQYTEKVWRENIPWCGRYTVPFGVMTVYKLFRDSQGKYIKGYPARYSDSYSSGVLPAYKMGLGLTAPFSLKHWVGYWAIVYYI